MHEDLTSVVCWLKPVRRWKTISKPPFVLGLYRWALTFGLVASIFALRTNADQTQNKSYQMSVLKSWLKAPAQSNITGCSKIKLTPIMATDGATDAFTVEASVVINGEARALNISFLIFPNDRYRVSYGPFYSLSEKERQAEAEREETERIGAAASRLFMAEWKDVTGKISPKSSFTISTPYTHSKITANSNFFFRGSPLLIIYFSDKRHLSIGEWTWDSLEKFAAHLEKFNLWNATAVANKVTGVKKPIGFLQNGLELSFLVDDTGVTSLEWLFNYPQVCSMSAEEVEATYKLIKTALDQITTLKEDCLKRAKNGEDFKAQPSKEELFK